MKLIIDVPIEMHIALHRSKFLNLGLTAEQSAIADGVPLDDVIEEIEQAKTKQTLVALGCTEVNERIAHMRTASAYSHCLQILDSVGKESEVSDAGSD